MEGVGPVGPTPSSLNPNYCEAEGPKAMKPRRRQNKYINTRSHLGFSFDLYIDCNFI